MDESQKVSGTEVADTSALSAERPAHHRSVHSAGALKTCKRPDCGAGFRSKRELNAHLVTQHNYTRCKEPNCPKVFQHVNRMEKHWVKHAGKTQTVEPPAVKTGESNVAQLAEDTFQFLRDVLELCGRAPSPADAFIRMTSALMSGISLDHERSLSVPFCMHALELAQNVPQAPAVVPTQLTMVSVAVQGENCEGAKTEQSKGDAIKKRKRAPQAQAGEASVPAPHHRRKPSCYTCHSCLEVFDTRADLSHHADREHKAEPVAPPVAANPQVPVDTPGFSALFQPAEQLICIEPPCTMRFRTPKELVEHVELVHYRGPNS